MKTKKKNVQVFLPSFPPEATFLCVEPHLIHRHQYFHRGTEFILYNLHLLKVSQ